MVAVAYESWPLTRGSDYSDLTGEIVVFWKSGRLKVVVAYGKLSHREVRLYFSLKYGTISIFTESGKMYVFIVLRHERFPKIMDNSLEYSIFFPHLIWVAKIVGNLGSGNTPGVRKRVSYSYGGLELNKQKPN